MDENQKQSSSEGLEPSRAEPPAAPRPIPIYMPSPEAPTGRKKGSLVSKFLWSAVTLILLLSIIINVYLGIFLFAGGLNEREYRPGNKNQKIALIDLAGSIDMKMAGQMRAMLQHAARDRAVKGVILVINCPGGQVAPSNMINNYIRNFAEQTDKKVYVSIQQLGASGAYWAAAAAEKIYAQENALVGSIGVIYINLVLEEALKNKLGIEPVLITSTRSPLKDRGNPFRKPTDEDIAEITKDLDTIHASFVKVVSEGRNMPEEQAWELANGDVFDGPESLAKNLIDAVGFLDDAIDGLADELALTNPLVVRYGKPPTLREILLAGSTGLQDKFDLQKQLEQWAMSPRILALWPGQ